MTLGGEDASPQLRDEVVKDRKALLVVTVALALTLQALLYAWAGATALAYAITVGLCHW